MIFPERFQTFYYRHEGSGIGKKDMLAVRDRPPARSRVGVVSKSAAQTAARLT
jgi:hypothetical protein